jgi:hypothetical protein
MTKDEIEMLVKYWNCPVNYEHRDMDGKSWNQRSTRVGPSLLNSLKDGWARNPRLQLRRIESLTDDELKAMYESLDMPPDPRFWHTSPTALMPERFGEPNDKDNVLFFTRIADSLRYNGVDLHNLIERGHADEIKQSDK